MDGFDQPAFNLSNTATKAAPAKAAKAPGLASRLISGLTQAPKYFLNTDIVNPAKELAAQATGNQTAYQNAENAQTKTIGATPGEASKRLAGNTAQLVGTVAAPEAKGAGIASKIAAGAKGGAIVGAGSAAANDQNILKGAGEGALVGGAIPVAAKAVGKLLPGSVSNDLEAAGERPQPQSIAGKAVSNLNGHFQQMEANSAGYGSGAKLPGTSPEGLNPDESAALSKLNEKYRIPAGTPTTRLRAIQGQLNTAGQQIDQALQKSNVPLSQGDKQAIMDEFQNKIDQIPPTSVDNNVQKIATQLKQDFMGRGNIKDDTGHTLTSDEEDQIGVTGQGKVSDLVSMNQYRRGLDERIDFNRGNDKVDPDSEAVATAMRNTLSDQLGRHAPDIAGANKTYSELRALRTPELIKARNLENVSNSGGGFTGKLFNNPLVRGVENGIGHYGQKLTGGIASNGGENLPIAGQAGADTTSTLDSQVVANVQRAGNQVADRGNNVAIIHSDGTETLMPRETFNSLGGNRPGASSTTSTTPPSTSAPDDPTAPSPSASTPSAQSTGTPTDILGNLTNKTNNALTGQPAQRAATLAGAGAVTQPTSQSPAPTNNLFSTQPGTSPDSTGSSSNDVLGFAGGNSSSDTSGNPQMTQQDLVALIAADPTHASDYEDLYKTLNPTSTSTSLDATQQKEVTAGEAAINGMQQYADQIDKLAGGSTGNVATGTVSTLLGKYDPFASSSQKQAAALASNQREVAIQIATSLSGGTKPSAASVAEVENSLPKVTDSAQERQDKVNDFVSRMETNMRTYATPVSSITAGL